MALPPADPTPDDSAMETSEITARLAQSSFTAGLPVAIRRKLLRIARIEDVPDGTVLLAEGQACDELGILDAGRLALRLRVPGRHDATILTVEPGEIFGWSTLVPPHLSTSTCVAVVPSQVILLDGDGLARVISDDADLANGVLRAVLSTVARRLSATRLQLLDLYTTATDPW